MASGSADNIKQWKFPDGNFIQNMSGHNAIINSIALNEDNVVVSAGKFFQHQIFPRHKMNKQISRGNKCPCQFCYIYTLAYVINFIYQCPKSFQLDTS